MMLTKQWIIIFIVKKSLILLFSFFLKIYEKAYQLEPLVVIPPILVE